MVSQIATGYPTDRRGRPFRRRRYTPGIVALVLLLIAISAVWTIAVTTTGTGSTPTPVACPAPPPPVSGSTAPQHTVVSQSSMLSTTPAALQTFQVRVLNASGQRGAAHNALDDLTALGFRPAPGAAYADDTLYPDSMTCVAQIRFGDSTRAAAAAVWLALPCSQLVNDGRAGTVVDVALGDHYTATEQSQDAQAALQTLRTADPANPKATVDPALIRAAHKTAC